MTVMFIPSPTTTSSRPLAMMDTAELELEAANTVEAIATAERIGLTPAYLSGLEFRLDAIHRHLNTRKVAA